MPCDLFVCFSIDLLDLFSVSFSFICYAGERNQYLPISKDNIEFKKIIHQPVIFISIKYVQMVDRYESILEENASLKRAV